MPRRTGFEFPPMTERPLSPPQIIGRKAAEAGLNLRDARQLFEALYMADALALSGGSMFRAAERAGMEAPALYRKRAKNEARQEPYD